MKKIELNDTQLKHLNLFYLILECDGWIDEQACEKKLDDGLDINPEGAMIYRSEDRLLEVQLHIPVNMISLSIADRTLKHKIDLFFFYDAHPEAILEWLVRHRSKITIKNYHHKLKKSPDLCKTILLAESTAESIELKPLVIN